MIFSPMTKNKHQKVGDIIHEVRRKKKITQEALAKRTGLGVATIRRIEAGSSPNLSTLKLVADALKLQLWDLIK